MVKDTLVYDGWGNITSETDANFRGRYAWTGREIDTEINLQYNRARYYDPKIGRWTSQDPLGFDAGDGNLYRYVKNRPTVATDPNGLERRTVVWLTFDEMKAKEFSQKEINSLKRINARYGTTPQEILKQAGVKGDWREYVWDIGPYLDKKTGKGLTGPSGKEITAVVIRNEKTGEIVRVGWQLAYKGIPYGFDFFDSAKEMANYYEAYIQMLCIFSTQVLPVLSMVPLTIPGVVAGGQLSVGPRTARLVWRGPRIQSGVRQAGLRDRTVVDQIRSDMLSGRYRFEAAEGRIGGWRDAAGNYYIGEGHHRISAALENFEQTGNPSFVNRLLQNGRWTPGSPPASQIGPLPR